MRIGFFFARAADRPMQLWKITFLHVQQTERDDEKLSITIKMSLEHWLVVAAHSTVDDYDFF